MKKIILYFLTSLFSHQCIIAQDTIIVNHVSDWQFPTLCTNVYIEGKNLYSTTIDNIFQIYLLNEENNFILQGECLNVNGSKGILIKDTLAFTLCDTSLSIINISNFNFPNKLSEYPLQESGISGSDIRDSLLIFHSWQGLSIINISDPFLPYLEFQSTIIPGRPTIDNNLLYLLWDEAVDVFDISNPSSPIYVTSFADTLWDLQDIVVRNDTVIISRNWCISMSDCYSEVLFYKRMINNNHVYLYNLDIPYPNDDLELLNDYLFINSGTLILNKNTGEVVGRINYGYLSYFQIFFTSNENFFRCDANIEHHYEHIRIMEYVIVTNISDVYNSNVKEYFISQNFPNPFNPVTNIEFSIPNSGIVQLKVYDIIGNEISTIINEYKDTGKYEVEFDASNLSSGVYFYRMISGSYVETKKMVLLR